VVVVTVVEGVAVCENPEAGNRDATETAANTPSIPFLILIPELPVSIVTLHVVVDERNPTNSSLSTNVSLSSNVLS
jgi:hypothetical protein